MQSFFGNCPTAAEEVASKVGELPNFIHREAAYFFENISRDMHLRKVRITFFGENGVSQKFRNFMGYRLAPIAKKGRKTFFRNFCLFLIRGRSH
ncbi:hypothetical protein T11_11557 [Trichinella zimbabwensis]|uniref:Uncharacterized protein n=1 Tax=Trichinella zimbabwensis TaxID=268475 RepID=A0A0V1HGA5_9BILA|nr:hypothetical protein T11_11557 [Trichinella zimbabwensis]